MALGVDGGCEFESGFREIQHEMKLIVLIDTLTGNRILGKLGVSIS